MKLVSIMWQSYSNMLKRAAKNVEDLMEVNMYRIIKFSVIMVILGIWGTICIAAESQKIAHEDDLGANVIILNKKEIQSYNVSTIVELLNRLPGISTTQFGLLNMGGFNASDIIVILDGRPINDQTITAKYVKWGEVDFSSVERVEIYKISSRCSGGEIKIFTQKKSEEVGGLLKTWRGAREHKGISSSCKWTNWEFSHNYETEGEHHHNNNDKERSNSIFKFGWKRINSSFFYSEEDKGSAIYSYNTPQKTRPVESDEYYPDPTKPRYREKLRSYGGVANSKFDDFYIELFVNDHLKKTKQLG